MPDTKHKNFHFWHYNGREWENRSAPVIVEKPVSITVNGEPWLSLRCTPTDLKALALGFLYNEGIINTASEVADIRPCPSGDNVDVWLHHTVARPTSWQRTSGCTGGVTSHTEASDLASPAPALYNGVLITTGQVGHLIAELFDAQDLYRSSGGVHTSALSDGQTLRVIAEDIGRHNTLDKIAGRMLLEGQNFSPRILLTTGRVSSEMLQKSARLGASIVISRTSPSSFSLEMAEKWRITLIGYARRNQFNVYTQPQRLLDDSKTRIMPNKSKTTS